MTTVEQIFEGAVFTCKDGDTMIIEIVKPNWVYARSDYFDTESRTKEEMANKLDSWGYKYIGVN